MRSATPVAARELAVNARPEGRPLQNSPLSPCPDPTSPMCAGWVHVAIVPFSKSQALNLIRGQYLLHGKVQD